MLQKSYISQGIYEYHPGRALNKSNLAKDFIHEGFIKLQEALPRWIANRTFERATDEDWPSDATDDDDVAVFDDEEASGGDGPA